MTASFICVAYSYSLRGYEGLWVESQRMMDVINLGKHGIRNTHVLVTVMGIFKGEDGSRINLLPLENVTSSDIRICMWL